MNVQHANRRRFLQLATGCAVASLAPSIARRGVAQSLDTLIVGASPFINQGTIFMASEMGLFSKVGLDVKVRSFSDGALIVTPLLSGEIDIGAVTCSAAL